MLYFLIFYHNIEYITIKNTDRTLCLGRVKRNGDDMFRLKTECTEYENKSLRLPKDLIETVQKLADDNNMSFNRVVTQCIEYALENMEEPHK